MQAPAHLGNVGGAVHRPYVGGSVVNNDNNRGYGYGYGYNRGYGGVGIGLGLGYGYGGYGYGNGYGYNRGYGYGYGNSYASVGVTIVDPLTGFVYYCPYGLSGWQGWGSGFLPYGAYRIR
jgi:hypothetical protein